MRPKMRDALKMRTGLRRRSKRTNRMHYRLLRSLAWFSAFPAGSDEIKGIIDAKSSKTRTINSAGLSPLAVH